MLQTRCLCLVVATNYDERGLGTHTPRVTQTRYLL